MINVRIHFRDRKLWKRVSTSYTRGNAYLSRNLISGRDLSQVFSRERSFDSFLSLLKRLNGFFAVIHQVDDELFVAVDHIRSSPLFFGSGRDEFYVSDDPHWVIGKINAQDVDELSAEELLAAGFVTGNETLCPRVKQVQAGEALRVRSMSKEFRVRPVRYYQLMHGNCFRESREQLLDRLDKALMVAFERLISWANGRTIVVPLSGGFDSRLIVLMLKRLGYARMIAFSYGRPGNKESEISREVASALGIQWEFVPYSNAAWRRWSGTEEWRTYCRTSNGLTSVPNIQDWPAIWELQRQELIPQDSVFVPGHTAGHSRHSSHVPIAWLERRTIYEKELLDSIRKTWYTLQDLSRHRELELKLNEKMTRLLMTRRSYTQEGAVADYERWWWQEREAKFTINSVRAYDFWGYEWWLPLWDMDLVKFWSRVPFVQRLEENLHTTHIQDLEMKLLRRNIEQWGTPSVLSVVARLLRKMRIYDHAVRRYELRQYDRHPLAWYGIMTKDAFYRSFTGKETINSYLAAKTLQSTFLDHDLLKGLTKHSDFSTGG